MTGVLGSVSGLAGRLRGPEPGGEVRTFLPSSCPLCQLSAPGETAGATSLNWLRKSLPLPALDSGEAGALWRKGSMDGTRCDRPTGNEKQAFLKSQRRSFVVVIWSIFQHLAYLCIWVISQHLAYLPTSGLSFCIWSTPCSALSISLYLVYLPLLNQPKQVVTYMVSNYDATS